MKKQYEIPLLEWVLLNPSDIITESDNDANFLDCWADQIFE